MNRTYYKPSFKNRKIYGLYNKRRTAKNIECSKQKAETNVTCSVPLETYNSEVTLFPSRCQLRKTNRTTAIISKYHILENKSTGQDICRNILNTDIGLSEHYRNINLDSVVPELSPILEEFKNHHNRFNYFNKLKHITENGQSIQKCQIVTQKYKNQINISLLQFFFSSIIYKNVPFQLFGTSKNQMLIKKTIYHLLKTVPEKVTIESAFKRTVRRKENVTRASLNIQPLLEKLDISNITWLYAIDNKEIQWIIILKLLHWFFTQYIIKILHKYVVLKVVQKRWVYITKDNWCNMQKEFIEEKKSSFSLVPCIKLEKKCNIGTYKFIPSSSNLRALFIAKYNIKERYDDNDIVLRFLQQLYITYLNKNGIPTVEGCRKEISNFVESKSKNRLYFVSCDIQDAFGSILQQKLYDIIIMYCQKLKNYLALRIFICKTKNGYRKKFTVQFLSYYLNGQIIKNASPCKKKPKLIQTKNLIKKIYKLIFYQKVKLNNQIYSIKLGVPQGASISPILSDIYYQHMCEEIFSKYANNEHSLLCRYIDDIIYITDNKCYAAKFLEIVRNGILSYNVKFNPQKIKSNIEISDHASMEIKFLKQISIVFSDITTVLSIPTFGIRSHVLARRYKNK